jgi:ABC-type transport system involved in cytochrome bd biosynthesis fused ATPase/permease subunit
LQKLKKKTVIIIAHRLDTIMHCDKIIVMKDGEIVEMGKNLLIIKGKPIDLININESYFSKMLNETGSDYKSYLINKI